VIGKTDGNTGRPRIVRNENADSALEEHRAPAEPARLEEKVATLEFRRRSRATVRKSWTAGMHTVEMVDEPIPDTRVATFAPDAERHLVPSPDEPSSADFTNEPTAVER
jgi:hypothetical protein